MGDNIVEYTEVTTENNQYPPLTSSRKGIFLQTEYFAGNQIASDDNTGYNIVPYGYFTYRHMSDDEIFHFNINDIVENGIVSTLYPVFTTDENLDSRYLQYQLNYGHEFAKFAILQKQGGSRTYMYLNKLKQLYLTMPKSVEEQKAISAFFMNLDHLITLHQRKCDETKKLKKFMLQKMFPKKDAKKPEIRFAGFTDDWEQRKVSDVAKIIAGGTPSTKENSYWEPKEIPWLSSGEVHKKYITFTDDMISQIGMNNSSAKMVAKDSVLIALAGQGKTRGTVAINRIPLTTNQSIAAMTFNENFIPEFVFYNLENRYDELRRMSSGDGSRGGLNKQLVGDIEIPYTEKKEQERIGSFFESLDRIIALHQRKCDELKEFKKYMLQNMFPQKG